MRVQIKDLAAEWLGATTASSSGASSISTAAAAGWRGGWRATGP